jgi:hypothetical protein
MHSNSLEASGSQQRSKMAIPRLDRRMPAPPLDSSEKHKEDRMYDPQARNSVLSMLTVAPAAALVKRAENEVCVHLITVLSCVRLLSNRDQMFWGDTELFQLPPHLRGLCI